MNLSAGLLKYCGCAALVAAIGLLAGCGDKPTAQTQPAAQPTAESPAAEKTPEGGIATKPAEEKPAVPQRDLAAEWKGLAGEVAADLQAGNLSKAESTLEKLDKIYAGDAKPSAQQQAEFTELETKIADARRAALDAKRQANLVEAEKQMNFGKLEDAQKLVGEIIAHNPTPDQHAKANLIKEEIERRRRAKRDLQAYMNMLASTNRREVEAAQFELLKDPETALSLLAEASQRTDKPALATNALESLGLIDRPQQALPILVEVLRRDSQQKLWPVATKEIIRMAKPGAGEALLELALAEVPVEQRMAALETLTQIVDPPSRTLVALLPLLQTDGPMQRLAFAAALHGVITHQQFDLIARRGLDSDLSPELEAQLDKLPQRLETLLKAGATPENADIGRAAQSLAIALRFAPAAPLSGLKVHLFEAEVPEAPAAAVLDGVWNSVDPKTMWRHGLEKRSSITLDLGAERTVVGVKIWNFNEPGGMMRGWKDFEIYVGSTGSETTPVAKGIVPMAPGAADTPDYGSVINVPFVRGRYIRLQAIGPWQPNAYMGLSEIQVMGF